MYDVILLSLAEGGSGSGGCGGACGACGSDGSGAAAATGTGASTAVDPGAASSASTAAGTTAGFGATAAATGTAAGSGLAAASTAAPASGAATADGEAAGAGVSASYGGAGGPVDGAGASGVAVGAAGGAGCGHEHGDGAGCGSCTAPRVPVLKCAEALVEAGARVETVVAGSDAEIDAVIARFDGAPRSDGLSWPEADGKVRLVLAVATDGQLRAVMRRLVRRYAPPPSKRPADLADGRTVPDLPPVAILPLDPGNTGDLAAQLGLPREPAAVAAAVLNGNIRRLDLLRNDGGSVTVDGALVGGADDAGAAVPWRGRVEVDDAVLSDGTENIVACAIGNAGAYAEFDGLRLLADGDPTDGRVEVAVAVPTVVKQRFRRPAVRIEVRRARGRAVSVLPRDTELQFLDDGVAGTMKRKRSWWTEAGAWAVYET